VHRAGVGGGYLPLHVMISLLPPRPPHLYLSGVISAQGQYMEFEVHNNTKNFGDLDRGRTVRSSNNGRDKRLFCSPMRGAVTPSLHTPSECHACLTNCLTSPSFRIPLYLVQPFGIAITLRGGRPRV